MSQDTYPSVIFTVDRLVGKASTADYDVLILPGGAVNPENLRQHEAAVGLVRNFLIALKKLIHSTYRWCLTSSKRCSLSINALVRFLAKWSCLRGRLTGY